MASQSQEEDNPFLESASQGEEVQTSTPASTTRGLSPTSSNNVNAPPPASPQKSASWFNFKVPVIQNPFLTVAKTNNEEEPAEVTVQQSEEDGESIALVQNMGSTSYTNPPIPVLAGAVPGLLSPVGYFCILPVEDTTNQPMTLSTIMKLG
jgi:hypothetical protein